MRKELVDYIGNLLFGNEAAAEGHHTLHLHSEKQFRVNSEGRLEKEQSVLTNIVVDKDAIYLNYLLPDGKEVCFVNAVKQVDCTMNNDYTIGSIIYLAEPVKQSTLHTKEEEPLRFTLQCNEDGVRFYEDMSARSGNGNKTLFEIQ